MSPHTNTYLLLYCALVAQCTGQGHASISISQVSTTELLEKGLEDHFGTESLSGIPPNALCSLFGFSNGTYCGCGAALYKQCPTLRGVGGLECTKCVALVEFNGTQCSASIKQDYCGKCSPEFDFEWIDEIPPNVHNISINDDAVFDLCQQKINVTNVTALAMPVMDLLQIFGCHGYVWYGYLKGLGFSVTEGNQTGMNTSAVAPMEVAHSDSMEFIIYCCKNFRNANSTSYCHDAGSSAATAVAWQFLSKATKGCERVLIEKELTLLGIQLPEIAPKKQFGGMYVLDLRKLSSVFEPVLGVTLRELYGGTLRFLLGLTLAAAQRHSCGHSWFVPGADNIYSDTFQIQGDFYFPNNVPSPFESGGTCGSSGTSEELRFDACDHLGTYLYDNAHMSGMSIIMCTVDCTASRLTHVEGAFVSVIIVVVEVDTRTSGFGQKQHGLSDTVRELNVSGMSVTNDAKATVGIGYRFDVKQLASESLITNVSFTYYSNHLSSVNLTTAMVLPNLTEAMLAYRSPTPPHVVNTKVDTNIIIAVVVPCTLLVGVLIGVYLHKRPAQPQQPQHHQNRQPQHHHHGQQQQQHPDGQEQPPGHVRGYGQDEHRKTEHAQNEMQATVNVNDQFEPPLGHLDLHGPTGVAQNAYEDSLTSDA
eukprot:m.191258 g.191258  ORF g.191258 m.191258 type:complete len:648 (-) comp32422_c0_seq7:120-2063(-)